MRRLRTRDSGGENLGGYHLVQSELQGDRMSRCQRVRLETMMNHWKTQETSAFTYECDVIPLFVGETWRVGQTTKCRDARKHGIGLEKSDPGQPVAML